MGKVKKKYSQDKNQSRNISHNLSNSKNILGIKCFFFCQRVFIARHKMFDKFIRIRNNVNLKIMAKTKVMAGRTLAVAEAKVADV